MEPMKHESEFDETLGAGNATSVEPNLTALQSS
jgi:hypothetical protein